MYTVKRFKTQEALDSFIQKNEYKIQYNVIYINNGYAVEYKPLIKVY